jgi:hypothetical protein
MRMMKRNDSDHKLTVALIYTACATDACARWFDPQYGVLAIGQCSIDSAHFSYGGPAG